MSQRPLLVVLGVLTLLVAIAGSSRLVRPELADSATSPSSTPVPLGPSPTPAAVALPIAAAPTTGANGDVGPTPIALPVRSAPRATDPVSKPRAPLDHPSALSWTLTEHLLFAPTSNGIWLAGETPTVPTMHPAPAAFEVLRCSAHHQDRVYLISTSTQKGALLWSFNLQTSRWDSSAQWLPLDAQDCQIHASEDGLIVASSDAFAIDLLLLNAPGTVSQVRRLEFPRRLDKARAEVLDSAQPPSRSGGLRSDPARQRAHHRSLR